MSNHPEIQLQLIHSTKLKFSQDRRLTDDLLPGTFFDDPCYFDSLPRDAKVLACAVQAAGEHPDRSLICHVRSEKFRQSYCTNKEHEYLRSAMASEAMALRWMSAEQPERGRFNQHMGLLFTQKFELSSNLKDLDQAIRHAELAVQHSKWGDEELSNWLTCLASLLMKRYSLVHQVTDFDKAKECLDRALGLTESTINRILVLESKSDLPREAIQTAQPEVMFFLLEMLALLNNMLMEPRTPAPLCGSNCRSAGSTCMLLFSGSENQIWIEKSISYLAKSIVVSATGDLSTRALAEEEHAKARLKREHISSNPQNRETALKFIQKLIEKQPSILDFRVQLADLYREEGTNNPDPQLRGKRLDDAVELMEDAVSVMSASFKRRGRVYYYCSVAHYARFEVCKFDADINRAIECATLASETRADEISWRFTRMRSQCLLDRYEKHGQPQDPTDALTTIGNAIRLMDAESNPTGLAECRWVTGKVLQKEYDAKLANGTLKKAIENFEDAARYLPEPSTSRTLALNDLGNAYSVMFTLDPDPRFLDNCIAALKESFIGMEKMYSHAPHPNLLMLNTSLAGAMLRRFRYWHLEEDLKSSISYYQKALHSLSFSDARYAPRAGNLCQALRELFEVQGEVADLKLLAEGQSAVAEALGRPEILGPQIKSWLELQLGDGFCRSFSKTKLPSDKANAIEHYDAAMALPNLPLRQLARTMNKALVLKMNAENTGSEEDFMLSYKMFEEIKKMMPEDDPNAWLITFNCANVASEMYKRRLGPNSHTKGIDALEKYKLVVMNLMAPINTRINAASIAAALAYDVQHDAESARDLINICLAMLPKSVLLHETRVEQLKVLRRYHFIPSGAAALSLAAGDPVSLAIQRLETGRANIWDRMLGQKTSVESLTAVDETLAKRFQASQLKLSTHLMVGRKSRVGQEPTFVVPNDEKRLQRERDARDYQQLAQEIRQTGLIPEFLDPFNDTGHLQELADDAPIVFINASKYRSDALIVVKDREPFKIRLLEFNMDEIESQAAVFLMAEDKYSSGIEETIAEGFADYNSIMKWLWESAARPVIEAIDFSSYARGPSGKPRIIWVATGWMTVFPIHAAGDFGSVKGSGSSVHDRVVSTYTTSLKSLDFSKRRKAHWAASVDLETDTAVIVAMSSTPGMKDGDLNIEPEIKSFEEELNNCMRVEFQRHKGSQEIRDHLKRCRMAHFACHGLIDWKDPSKSALLLKDCAVRDKLKQPQPFCVWAMLNMLMENCGIVYLSACHSGANRDLLLQDEGLHVAGAFHIAGVPHVVSTLWAVRDSISSSVSRHFYANLKNDQGLVDLHRSADALHIAIQKLRDRGEEPMVWGPFVHSGS